MPQNDFAARLARIEAKRPVSEPPAPADSSEDGLFDAGSDAVSGTAELGMQPEIPHQARRGSGIARMLAWIGLLIGLGAMGTAGAILMTNKDSVFATNNTAKGQGTAATGRIAIGSADGLAPAYTGPAWWEGDRNLTELFGPELNASRSVTAYKHIAVSDLPEGSSTSDLNAFATEQGATYFGGYCEEMRAVLAADCGGGDFNAKVTPDGRSIQITGTFNFAPSLWVGSSEQVSDGQTNRGEMELTTTGDMPDTEESRREIYARAVSLCGGLRAMYGNCMIEGISLYVAGDAEDNRITARAWVQVYASETELDRNALRAEIARVTQARDQALMVLSFL